MLITGPGVRNRPSDDKQKCVCMRARHESWPALAVKASTLPLQECSQVSSPPSSHVSPSFSSENPDSVFTFGFFGGVLNSVGHFSWGGIPGCPEVGRFSSSCAVCLAALNIPTTSGRTTRYNCPFLLHLLPIKQIGFSTVKTSQDSLVFQCRGLHSSPKAQGPHRISAVCLAMSWVSTVIWSPPKLKPRSGAQRELH